MYRLYTIIVFVPLQIESNSFLHHDVKGFPQRRYERVFTQWSIDFSVHGDFGPSG